MLRDDIVHGIRKTWEVADELGIAEVFSSPATIDVNEEFRNLIFSESTNYVKLYMAGLRLSHYNILLHDYSYFQFGWDKEDHVRYAFFPNPFVSGKEHELQYFKDRRQLVAAEMLTHEDFLRLLTDRPPVSGVPMWRYENSPVQRKKFNHPCSHFHIGFHSENRWPLARILTPLAFSLLVFKAYYGSPWRGSGDDENAEISNRYERMLIAEKSNCPIVGHSLFEDLEKRTFFFG